MDESDLLHDKSLEPLVVDKDLIFLLTDLQTFCTLSGAMNFG